MHTKILLEAGNHQTNYEQVIITSVAGGLGVWIINTLIQYLRRQRDKKAVWMALYEFQKNGQGRYKSIDEISKKVNLTKDRIYHICCIHKHIIPAENDNLWQTAPGVFLYGTYSP